MLLNGQEVLAGPARVVGADFPCLANVVRQLDKTIIVPSTVQDRRRDSCSDTQPERWPPEVYPRRPNDRLLGIGPNGNFPVAYRGYVHTSADVEETDGQIIATHSQGNRRWANHISPNGKKTVGKSSETNEKQSLEKKRPGYRRRYRTAIREKIAKFLNLFTVVQFSNEVCESLNGGVTGTCYHHLQCRSLGGHPSGACAQGYGVCCLFEKTCGQTSRYNSTYFVNPAQENVEVNSGALPDGGFVTCFLTIEKLYTDVTQLRIDFLHFEVAGPSAGTCLDERFIVIGQDKNSPVPVLCGSNTGQHMFVQVSMSSDPVQLGVQWRVRPGPATLRRWVIRVSQLRARSEEAAPPGCLQYYQGTSGVVQSFGYSGVQPGYTNNLNYAICIRKEAGFCTLTYFAASPNGTEVDFQLTNEDQEGAPTLPPGQAGAEIFNCPDDYIVINGVRLCGERLNDASVDPDYTHNAPVTDTSGGAFILPVRTNGNATGRGFQLFFRQNTCVAL